MRSSEFRDKAAHKKQKIKDSFTKFEKRHAEFADHADTAAKATRVIAAAAVVGASVAAPTGLTAIGVALGFVTAPVIVTAAPILVTVAGGAATLSAVASLYSKSRRKKQKHDLPQASQ